MPAKLRAGLHPPPDDGERACAITTVELADLESKIASAAERGAGARAAALRGSRRRGRWRAAPRSPRAAAALAALDVAAALAELAVESAMGAARRSTTSTGFRDQRRAPSDGRGGAAARGSGGGFVANDCDLGRGPAALARHRPQHGRQEHVPAAERADRDPGADGLLRAGRARRRSASSTACSAGSAPPTIWRAAARPSWSRWSRPRRS